MSDNNGNMGTSVRDVRTLKVWQKSKHLVIRVYEITDSFPRAEQYHIVDQMRRASTSIKANIAEGCGQLYHKKTISFLNNALGSASEVKDWLDTSLSLGYINQAVYNELTEKTTEIIRMTIGYLKSIKVR